MAERPVEHGIVKAEQDTHHPVALLCMKRTPHERRAQCRHHRDREQRRTDHRKCLGEGERVEKLPLASGEREHWHEGEDDDDHREKNRAADLPGGRQHRFPCLGGGEARRDTEAL